MFQHTHLDSVIKSSFGTFHVMLYMYVNALCLHLRLRFVDAEHVFRLYFCTEYEKFNADLH